MHRETVRARRNGGDPCYDDACLMFWHRPHGGPRGQQISVWDSGWWECDTCKIRLHTEAAGLLLDAALMHADPHCDSIGPDGYHADTIRAFAGGPA